MHKQNGEPEDDFEVTITDLVPKKTENPGNLLANLWPMTDQGKKAKRRIFITCIILLICLLTLTTAPSLYGQALGFINPFKPHVQGITTNASLSASSTSEVEVDGAMTMWNPETGGNIVPNSDKEIMITPGSLPQDCPAEPITSASEEVGQFPLKIIGFSGSSAIVHLQNVLLFHIHYWRGWPIPLQLESVSNNTTPVTLTIGNLHKGPIPIFAFSPTTASSQVIILDSQHPTNTFGPVTKENNHVGRWDTRLYVPGAGCYTLTISWPQGHWQIIFAAGL